MRELLSNIIHFVKKYYIEKNYYRIITFKAIYFNEK